MARQSNTSVTQQFPLLARAWNSPFAFRNPSLLADLEHSMFEPSLFNERSFPTGVTMFEQGNQLIVKADVPGLSREDIEITYNKGILNIRTEHKEEKEEKKGNEERRYWSLSQSQSYALTLPCSVDDIKEPTASLDKGVLTLTFNKPHKDAAKRITIK